MGIVEGFDGDSDKEAELRARLSALLDAFPEHLEKSRPPTWYEPEELARNAQFDAILRAHKKDRLAIPIQALREVNAAYHGFLFIQPPRLVWFVPSILAAWLDGQPSPRGVFGPSDIESIIRDMLDEDWEWTDEQAAALGEFFDAALDAALATPLRPARAEPSTRSLEDGIRVWSLHSPSVPLDVLRVAKVLRIDLDPLIQRWAFDESPLAFDHLLEAVYDVDTAAKHFLAHEAVAHRLGEAFFETTGERQARVSKAEATVRRNIGRREDI